MPAHWLIELGGEPLVGRAMGRGVSRSSCGLRKSASSFFALGGTQPTQPISFLA